MSTPQHTALAEMFYAAGDLTRQGELSEAHRVLLHASTLLSELLNEKMKRQEEARKSGLMKHIRLLSYGKNKINVIKAFREGCSRFAVGKYSPGLKASKEVVERLGGLLSVDLCDDPFELSENEANSFANMLRRAGATVEVEPARTQQTNR